MRLMIRSFMVGAALVAVACKTTGSAPAPTKVTREWHGTQTEPALRKIVVQAENVTPETRRRVEDRLSSELTRPGLVAVPSYRAMGETLPERAEGLRMLQARGFDGALVVRVGHGETRTYASSKPTGYPQYGPGPTRELVTETSVTSQAALWDLSEQRAVWSATTRTNDATTGDSVARGLAKAIAPALTDEPVVAP